VCVGVCETAREFVCLCDVIWGPCVCVDILLCPDVYRDVHGHV
jgi:hypothetical protein